MTRKILFAGGLCALLILTWAFNMPAQRRKPAPKPQIPRICGDPTVKCKTDFQFEPFDLPFDAKSEGGPIQETELFYAVVVKTVAAKDEDCDKVFIPEKERLKVQKLFPRNKVFADRCPIPGGLYYTGFNHKFRFLAIYGGKTKAAADKILSQIKDEYPKAYVRRTRAGFNGT